jgi:uncharacterized protein YqgV (UPF0045/DUF77 family)
MNVFSQTLPELDSIMDSAQTIIENHKPKDEKLELLKEIQEYYERKENQRSMPLWLSVRIEKVINK